MESKYYTQKTIKNTGYLIICFLARELIIAGKRVAFAGELKSVKMLLDPTDVDIDDDWALMDILDERM